MLLSEFVERVGYTPTPEEWAEANKEYMAMPDSVNKDEYCVLWAYRNRGKIAAKQAETKEKTDALIYLFKAKENARKWSHKMTHARTWAKRDEYEEKYNYWYGELEVARNKCRNLGLQNA